MPISDDWDYNYSAKVLSHIDGVLSYDTGGGRQAAVGEYIRGNSSGAIGKILSVTGNTTSGTLTLTNVEGLFEDNETFEVLSFVAFDAVVDKASSLQGFRIGDTVVDQVSGSIVVRAIEYNTSEQTGGQGGGGGTLYGTSFAAFTNNSQLDISGGETNIALADGVGTNNDTALTTTQAAGTLAVPGTAQTNDCVIIHYDAGTVSIPEQAIVRDAVTGATALVEETFDLNTNAIGSLRLVDYNSTGGVFTDGNNLQLDQVIAYNNQVAGQVFSVGNVVVGATSGATGRVILDTGTQLVLADESGTWTTTEDLEVGGVKIADANGTNTTLVAAVINIPDGIRTEQWSSAVGGGVDQGGIYAGTDSLNVRRKLNSLYTLSQDTFDELLQMDDDEALDATVKDGAYQVVFDWLIPPLSFRFTRAGGVTMNGGQDVWANPQTVGAQNKITTQAFSYDANQPYRQPQLYIEQNQEKVPTHWLEGQIDALIQVRTTMDTRFIDPATPGLGQLIPGGDPAIDGGYAVFNREFHVSTYDATQFAGASGGVNTVALGTSADNAADRNPNGTHTAAFTTGGAGAYTVGETITSGSGNSLKVGVVVTSDTGTTGNVEYVLKSGTNFINTDTVVGEVSAKSSTFGTPTTVVAGYGTDIAFSVVDIAATPSGGTGITGTFIPGEPVTQAVTSATGKVVYANTVTDVLYLEVESGTFSGDNDITGDNSAAAWDAGTGATYPSAVTFDADLNNGEGAQPYSGSASGDITGASKQTIQDVYQYSKYEARHENAATIVEGPGTSDAGTAGRFFRKLKDAYSEVKPGNPFGVYTGAMAFAQGWFLDTGYIDANDIRSFSVVDDNGVSRNPPNLQALTLAGVATDWRTAAYRSTGAGLTTILRNEFSVGTVGGGNNQSADSTILLAAGTRSVSPTPADVPDSGVLRILDPNDTGNYLRFPYNSVNRTTNVYTLASGTIGAVTGSVDLTAADNAHVVLIEETSAGASVSNTIQYVADIPIVYKARLKGFKPFRSTGTFGNAGATLGVVQTADPIVDLP
jgi:hypothetical protein